MALSKLGERPSPRSEWLLRLSMLMRLFRWLLALTLLAVAFGGAGWAQGQVWVHSYDAYGQPFDLASQRGKVVALTFASRHTRDEAAEVNDELAERAGPDFIVVGVVNLMDVPDTGRGAAKSEIGRHERPGRVELIVDDTGNLKRALQADPRHRVDILVIDQQGILRGHYAGLGELGAAIRQIDQLRRAR